MMKLSKKLMVSLSLGLVLTGAISGAGSAMDIWTDGMTVSNPITSAPNATVTVTGGSIKNLSLRVSAAKAGYATKTSSDSWVSAAPVSTVSVSGPTYASKGTTFSGSAVGTDSQHVLHKQTYTPVSF